jgi:hypothetical protein
MSLKDFGEGHKGAGNTPIVGGSEGVPTEQPAETGGQSTFNFEPASSAKDVEEKFNLTKPVEQGKEVKLAKGVKRHIDSQGIPRLIVPGVNEKGEKVALTALYPDEFHGEGGKLSFNESERKKLFIRNGGAIIGETHDETGAPLKEQKVTAYEPPKRSFADLVQEAKASEKPLGIEEKMRANMPGGPGTGKASKSLRSIVNESGQHLKILIDHWYATKQKMDGAGSPELSATHEDIGQGLGVAQQWLQNANELIDKKPHDANVHLRLATELIHRANETMHEGTYSMVAGQASPVPLTATETNRASSLAEHAVPNRQGNINDTVRIHNTRFENNIVLSNRLEEIKRGLNHPDPSVRGRYAGLYPDLVKLKAKLSKQGTAKGGAEWDSVNVGPNTRRDDLEVGQPVGSSRVGEVKQAMSGTAPGTFMPTNRPQLRFVYTHPKAHPVGTEFSVDDNPLSQTYGLRRHVYTDPLSGQQVPLARLAASELVKVPFGQHHGLKVVNDKGVEIPATVQEATGTRALTFEELKQRGAMTESIDDPTPIPSHPGATAPGPVRTPPPTGMGSTNEQQEGKRKRAAAAAEERNNLITDTTAAIETDKETALQQKMIEKNKQVLSGIEQKENEEPKPRKRRKSVISADTRKYMEEHGLRITEPTQEPTKEEGK